MEITRRNLLKLGTVLGAGSLLPGCIKDKALRPKEAALPRRGEEEFSVTVCGMCRAGCGIRVRKVDGRAVGVSGVPDHPINQGALCPKGAAILQELHHPDRLQSPMARTGERGSGHWKEISWDEAVAQLVGKISSAQEKKNNAFAAVAREGNWDIHQDLLKKLAGALGKDNLFTLRSEPEDLPREAYQKMHGNAAVGHDFSKARLLVSFGFDWLETHPSHVEAQRIFAEMRRKAGRPRAHIVQVESRFSRTAAKADQWVPVRPGTEAIFALGVAQQILLNGNYDKQFIAAKTHGFDAFKKALENFPPEKVSKITGVPEKEIRILALKFMSLRPSLAISQGNPQNQMAAHSLNALMGNMGETLVAQSSAGRESFSRPGKPEGTLPEVLLFDRVNPLFNSPQEWKEIFRAAPFIATVSPFMSETAEFSDLVFPCHASLEQSHCSIHHSMEGPPVVNAAPGAIRPLYETKNPGEIFMMVERRVQGKDVLQTDFNSYLATKAEELGASALLEQDNNARWLIAKEIARPLAFKTRSGKFEFDPLTDSLKRDPLSADGKNEMAEHRKDFPLSLAVFTPLAFSNGEGAHLPYLQSIAGPQVQEMWGTWAEVNPETAHRFGIRNGGMMWIESQQGKIRVKAHVTSSSPPEVVSVPFGLGHSAYGRWAKGVGANPMEIVGKEAGPTSVRIQRG